MKRFVFLSLCLAGVLNQAVDWASACPPVAVQSLSATTTVAVPAMVGVQALSVPTVQVQTLAVPSVQVQTLTVPTVISSPVVVQQVVRQRPVRVRSRTITRTGFGLGLF